MAEPFPGRHRDWTYAARMGHLFIIEGNIAQVACDAWLLPTDRSFHVTESFAGAIGHRPGHLVGFDWADRRVVRYGHQHGDGKGPVVVLGNVGLPPIEPAEGSDNPEHELWIREVVDAFAELGAGLGPGRRRPLLACPALGTGWGGFRNDRGTVYRALIPALRDAAAAFDVDLVLVCHGRDSYAAAQRMRRTCFGDDAAEHWAFAHDAAHKRERARALAAHAVQQELVLFLGAGVSIGAGLPAWQGLLDRLAERLDTRRPDLAQLHRHDVRDQAALLQKRFREEQRDFAAEIGDLLGSSHYSLAHGLLASIRPRESVTTNFDQLFEAAMKAGVGNPALCVLPYEPLGSGRPWLLKLHGSIDRPGGLVFTRGDYHGATTANGALFGIVQALLMTRHMLFVGYSLTDEDFYDLVQEVRGAVVDTRLMGTVLTLFDDGLFNELWDDLLEVVPMAPAATGIGPSDDEIAHAARELELFLDLLAFESADLRAFLLDPTYARMRTPDERELAAALEQLAAAASAAGTDSPGWRQVSEFLHGFGWPSR